MIEKMCFVGAGSMAESIIAGILHNHYLPAEAIVVTNKSNRDRLKDMRQLYGIREEQNKEVALNGADVIVLATKPYDLFAAIDQIKSIVKPGQLIISVVAGVATDAIREGFGKDLSIIRVMPNTSASIGASATAITAGGHASESDVQQAEELCQTIGTTVIVAEEDMHTVTGVSGSGPAYFYFMVEAMEKVAVDAGLDPETAKALITQTVIGAGAMLKQSDDPAHVLREKITSPAGTTQAGLEALSDGHFQETVMAAVSSARKRSIELGEEK